jgi:hypothetical protein
MVDMPQELWVVGVIRLTCPLQPHFNLPVEQRTIRTRIE